MKYYIISGEASGDLHGSNLVKEILARDTDAQIRAWGGDLMQAAGADVVKHYRDLAFMGFAEVLMNLRTILRNLKQCKYDILDFNPDVVILVDYPGFNLRIARFAFESGFRVHYYISPQIWAWKQSRVQIIRKYVHKMMVILPFEKEFYAKFGYQADFVGHPLLDAVSIINSHYDIGADSRKIIALLPGSRRQEISVMLPLMLEAVTTFKDYRFVIAGAPSIPDAYYKSFTNGYDVDVVSGNTYGLLSKAHAALVTSGTATLETALFNVPQVVCYKGNPLSYQIAKWLVKVKYISLVNLVMDREVVKELIQHELNTDNIKSALNSILDGSPGRQKMLDDYIELRKLLGGPGASARTANLIVNDLKLSTNQ
ncbi:MAG: lipid-A-disaccharide synthase [Bacteroidota bacterium]